MSEIVTKLPGDDYFGIALAVNNLSMMQDAHQQIARYVYDCMSKYAGPNHETECVKMLVTMQEAIAALQPGSSREIARFETKPGADYMTGGIDLGDHANAIEIHGKTETEIRNRLEWLLRAPAPVAVTVDDSMLTRFFAEQGKYSIGRDTAAFPNKLHLVYKLDATPVEVVFDGNYEACEMFIAKRALSAALAGEVG